MEWILIVAPSSAVYVTGWYITARIIIAESMQGWQRNHPRGSADAQRKEHSAVTARVMVGALLWPLMIAVLFICALPVLLHEHLMKKTVVSQNENKDLRELS